MFGDVLASALDDPLGNASSTLEAGLVTGHVLIYLADMQFDCVYECYVTCWKVMLWVGMVQHGARGARVGDSIQTASRSRIRDLQIV